MEKVAPKLKGTRTAKTVLHSKPLYQDGTICIPVDTRCSCVPVISREEAEKLIDAIPEVKAEAYHDRNFTQLAAHYQAALGSHECADLIELVMSIYAKKQFARESRKRKIGGQVDARFMKRGEPVVRRIFSRPRVSRSTT